MNDVTPNRIPLHLPGKSGHLATFDVQVDDRIQASLSVKHTVELAGIHRYRRGFCLVAVDDGRDPAVTAQAAGYGAAPAGALGRFKFAFGHRRSPGEGRDRA